MQDDYWEQSIQPLNCLAFVVPLLALYEVGVVWIGPAAMRNGADVWLRHFLSVLGFSEYFFLPLVTCGFLLGWHHLTKRDWKLRPEVVSGMVCESFVLGVFFIVVAQFVGQFLNSPMTTDPGGAALSLSGSNQRVPQMLSFIGAGIYEELLFRLILLSGTIAICRKVGADKASTLAFSIIITSLLFAAAHYELFFHAGLEFTWYSFMFRASAGALFAVLFLYRGFGITVGTHAVYDVLVATIS